MTEIAPTSIREAVEQAAKVVDPLDDLVARAARDPGEPFTPANLALLRALKEQDRPRFENIRAELRAARVRIGELDRLIKQDSDEQPGPKPRHGLGLRAIEAWPHPVEGVALLDAVTAQIASHVVLPPLCAEAMALWAVYAHAFGLWQINPRLAILSPEKRCGKTTALTVLELLVPKPLPVANVTAAALFRTIDREHPTLLIDEADTFLTRNDELRGVLNSGHNRACANVIRTTGEDHEPASFSTWSPVVIAMIGTLPDTLKDRSIAVRLKRKRCAEVVQRIRLDRTSTFTMLARQIARWVGDRRDALSTWDGETPDPLHDRARDNWRPLLAIADIAGGRWPALARRAALALLDDHDEHSTGALLLGDIKRYFDTCDADRAMTATILASLTSMEDRPWPEWRQGKPITAPQLSALLRVFEIRPRSVRIKGEKQTGKGYWRTDFNDAFSRYLAQQPGTPAQPFEINDLEPIEADTREEPVPDGVA